MKFAILAATTVFASIVFNKQLAALSIKTSGGFAVIQIILCVLGFYKACELMTK